MEIHNHQRQVRVRHGAVVAAARSPRLLDEVFRYFVQGPDSGGVHVFHGNPVEGCGFGNEIACGTRNIGDDGAVLIETAG